MPAWKTQLLRTVFALCIAAHCQNGWASDCATAPAPQDWSRLAQQKVENYSEKALGAEKIITTVQSSKKDFLKSKPAIKNGKIYIHAYEPAIAERGSSYDEIWCKLKTRDAISDAAAGGPPQGEPDSCMVMNQAAIDWALKNVPDKVRSAYEKTGIRITCLPDQQYSRGDQWVNSSVRVKQDSGSEVTVQASSLRTAEWIPWLGGNQYCKLLSPRGAAELVGCLADMCDPALMQTGVPYALAETDGGLYTEGSRFTVTAGEDEVDIYVPKTGAGKPLAAAIFLQGAKCDKRFYGTYAKLVASYGFVVAIANHNSLLGKNFTEQKVFNRVWDFLKSQNRNPASPLYKRLDTGRVALLGHSYGGVASLGSMQSTCSLPFCTGFSYAAPKELAAVVLYGTNTKSPMSGKFMGVNTRGIPVLYINGDRDGKAIPADTLTTFREKTSGGPKALATVRGANHYGITDINNPPGGDSDPSAPTLPQKQANLSIARLSSMFLRAYLYNDAAARNYISTGEGRDDSAVSIETK
jgi:predicted dienelactone hydrolase